LSRYPIPRSNHKDFRKLQQQPASPCRCLRCRSCPHKKLSRQTNSSATARRRQSAAYEQLRNAAARAKSTNHVFQHDTVKCVGQTGSDSGSEPTSITPAVPRLGSAPLGEKSTRHLAISILARPWRMNRMRHTIEQVLIHHSCTRCPSNTKHSAAAGQQ
jgi:hypothetical protein